jgi:hypothetical protein
VLGGCEPSHSFVEGALKDVGEGDTPPDSNPKVHRRLPQGQVGPRATKKRGTQRGKRGERARRDKATLISINAQTRDSRKLCNNNKSRREIWDIFTSQSKIVSESIGSDIWERSNLSEERVVAEDEDKRGERTALLNSS